MERVALLLAGWDAFRGGRQRPRIHRSSSSLSRRTAESPWAHHLSRLAVWIRGGGDDCPNRLRLDLGGDRRARRDPPGELLRGRLPASSHWNG